VGRTRRRSKIRDILRKDRPNLILVGAASFALVWIVARASVQAVTNDEAHTYILFVERPPVLHFTPLANNHVLNSMLMRLCVSVFGASDLSIRTPALIGSAIYVLSAVYLCCLITDLPLLRLTSFLTMVFNPFVMDHLVAARGYSLALGFLMAAIAIASRWYASQESRPPAAMCAFSSALTGLSFSANFSFAFVDLVTMSVIFLLALRPMLKRGLWSATRLAAACAVPGSLIVLLLCGSTLRDWPEGQLYFGSSSLRELFYSIYDASLYRLNPEIVNPLMLRPLDKYLRPLVIPAAGFTAAAMLFSVLYPRRRFEEHRSQLLLRLATALTAIFGATLALHWISFRFFGLLLPKERTGLFFVPLAMLAAGAVVAIPPPSRTARILRACSLAAFGLLASYFLLAMRLTYFMEWRYDADVKRAYSMLACLNQTHGVRDVRAHWMYEAPLNYYRLISKQETLSEIRQSPFASEEDARNQVYVLNTVISGGFMSRFGLKTIYQGPATDMVIAVNPELEPSLRTSPCLLRPAP
jgi:hypothetical protein